MRVRKVYGFTLEQQEQIWKWWKQGESFSDIGRLIDKPPGCIHPVIGYHGGIYPKPQKRSNKALTLAEREEISRACMVGKTIRQIALILRRAPSTISREIKRNGGKNSYRAHQAENKAWQNAKRPKLCQLATNTILRDIIAEKIALKWSPEQISNWLKQMYPTEKSMWISHETIYKSWFIQSRGVLKKSLIEHLRSKRLMRRPKHAKIDRAPRGQIIDGISIKERPAEVEDRAIPGHWEGDLISGSKNTHIATLVERASRFTLLVKVAGKDAASVTKALSQKIQMLPAALRLSLTWDRGMELAYHKQLSLATDLKIYFCDPRSPWQRGTNENTNRLLRQYFPKKTDLSIYSQAFLDEVALQLNQRPRKTLAYKTPTDKLLKVVAMTD